MNNRPLTIAVIIVAAIVAIGALTVAGPCVHEDGSFGPCRASQVGIVAAGVVGVLAGVIALFVKNQKAAGAALVVAAAAGVFAAVAPGTALPLCMMATMRCHTIMQPFAQFAGIALAALAIIAAIRVFRAKA